MTVWSQQHAADLGINSKERKLATALNIDWLTLIQLFIQLAGLLLPFLRAVKEQRQTDHQFCTTSQGLLAEAKKYKNTGGL